MPVVATRDPAVLFGPEARRSPEMEALWARLVAEDGGQPNWLTLTPQEGRALSDGLARRWNAELPEVRSVEPVTVPGGAGRCRAEWIEPLDGGPGAILFLHGGGWAFGNPATHARFARLLAAATRLRVLALDYRLAPEHPFPAAFEDAVAAFGWLAEQAAGDPRLAGPLLVGGDSAGANLSLALCLDALARGGPVPAAGLLFYGAYTMRDDLPSCRHFAEGFGLTVAGMDRFGHWYAGTDDPRLLDDPRFAPLAAPDALLRRLPPLYINAAGLDPLLSDSLLLAERLAAAGVEHRFDLHAGVHHGFMQMSLYLEDGRDAFARTGAFVRDHAKA